MPGYNVLKAWLAVDHGGSGHVDDHGGMAQSRPGE